MSTDPNTTTTDFSQLQHLTLRQFLSALSVHHAPEDRTLSSVTVRMMMADIREHARRLHAELQDDASNG
jgi:hypothetical protein